MQEMRTACKDRLQSWEQCEAAAHQALLVASAHDASAVGEEEDAAEEEEDAEEEEEEEEGRRREEGWEQVKNRTFTKG